MEEDLNRRRFFAATVGALVASVLPVKAIPNVVHYGTYMGHLIPGDKVIYKCGYAGEKEETHTVEYVDDLNLLIECNPRGPCKYPLTHWLPRKGAL